MAFREISVADLEQLLGSGIHLVDVRESDEFESGHVAGAVHVPLGTVVERLDDLAAMGTVHVICHSGGRSAHACEFLSHQGIDAVNVVGGTMAWVMGGRPVVTGTSPT